MVIEQLYNLSIEVLTCWMPVFYTFKFLMNKEAGMIPTILKFWCVISCYSLFSLVLRSILNDQLYPVIHLSVLVALNWPPYRISQKVYDFTLGPIFKENKESFKSMEDSVISVFDKNTQKLRNTVKDSANDRVKGMMGNLLVATLNTGQPVEAGNRHPKPKKHRDSDSGSGSGAESDE